MSWTLCYLIGFILLLRYFVLYRSYFSLNGLNFRLFIFFNFLLQWYFSYLLFDILLSLNSLNFNLPFLVASFLINEIFFFFNFFFLFFRYFLVYLLYLYNLFNMLSSFLFNSSNLFLNWKLLNSWWNFSYNISIISCFQLNRCCFRDSFNSI